MTDCFGRLPAQHFAEMLDERGIDWRPLREEHRRLSVRTIPISTWTTFSPYRRKRAASHIRLGVFAVLTMRSGGCRHSDVGSA